MRELIYDSQAIKPILQRWPGAKITDASDYIHEGRFELEVDTTEDEFYPYAISEGFALSCFGLQLMMLTPDKTVKIRGWIATAETLLGQRSNPVLGSQSR